MTLGLDPGCSDWVSHPDTATAYRATYPELYTIADLADEVAGAASGELDVVGVSTAEFERALAEHLDWGADGGVEIGELEGHGRVVGSLGRESRGSGEGSSNRAERARPRTRRG